MPTAQQQGQTTVKGQLLAELARRIAHWTADGYRVGLYQEGSGLTAEATIANVLPCDFTGYGGLQVLGGWATPAWQFPRARTQAAPVQWTCTGPAVANSVGGLYVVTGAGELAWFEPRPGGPLVVGQVGQVYEVLVVQTLRSEYRA